jgi:arginyl-tRNA synthetase
VTDAAGLIRAELARAARVLGVEDAEPIITRPNDPQFGDWATNFAMMLARPLKQKPRDVAEKLIAALDKSAAGISSAEIAGPGFINFRVDQAKAAQGLKAIIAAGDQFGHSMVGEGKPVNIEFVSANPTGPLHVGHGRQAAIGDALASLLEWTGWKVTREFYYNDAGAQIHNLALSVQARVKGGEIPEGGYHGEYIREIAQQYLAEHAGDKTGDDLEAIRAFAVKYLRREQDLDLQAFGVKFDVYYLESSLYADGRVEQTIESLKKAGHTFEQDGALWLRTTDYGDDKDRVVVRSKEKGGTPTYFVPDVAYHVTKWKRGFTRAINVQGSDHHGTTARVRAGLQSLDMGVPEGYPEYVLHQMVTVMRAGEEVKISKRAGSYVTVRDLIDEVGRDAVRYFFLMRKGDSQLTFDVDLARTQSEENPVYYIQMAHARLSGIFRVGAIDPAAIDSSASLEPLTLPEEQELIKALVDFPSIIQGAAAALEPHRIANYLHDLAARTHLWYHKAHVLNEPDEIMTARLVLARAAQVVLKNGLTMLGISAPERM